MSDNTRRSAEGNAIFADAIGMSRSAEKSSDHSTINNSNYNSNDSSNKGGNVVSSPIGKGFFAKKTGESPGDSHNKNTDSSSCGAGILPGFIQSRPSGTTQSHSTILPRITTLSGYGMVGMSRISSGVSIGSSPRGKLKKLIDLNPIIVKRDVNSEIDSGNSKTEKNDEDSVTVSKNSIQSRLGLGSSYESSKLNSSRKGAKGSGNLLQQAMSDAVSSASVKARRLSVVPEQIHSAALRYSHTVLDECEDAELFLKRKIPAWEAGHCVPLSQVRYRWHKEELSKSFANTDVALAKNVELLETMAQTRKSIHISRANSKELENSKETSEPPSPSLPLFQTSITSERGGERILEESLERTDNPTDTAIMSLPSTLSSEGKNSQTRESGLTRRETTPPIGGASGRSTPRSNVSSHDARNVSGKNNQSHIGQNDHVPGVDNSSRNNPVLSRLNSGNPAVFARNRSANLNEGSGKVLTLEPMKTGVESAGIASSMSTLRSSPGCKQAGERGIQSASLLSTSLLLPPKTISEVSNTSSKRLSSRGDALGDRLTDISNSQLMRQMRKISGMRKAFKTRSLMDTRNTDGTWMTFFKMFLLRNVRTVSDHLPATVITIFCFLFCGCIPGYGMPESTVISRLATSLFISLVVPVTFWSHLTGGGAVVDNRKVGNYELRKVFQYMFFKSLVGGVLHFTIVQVTGAKQSMHAFYIQSAIPIGIMIFPYLASARYHFGLGYNVERAKQGSYSFLRSLKGRISSSGKLPMPKIKILSSSSNKVVKLGSATTRTEETLDIDSAKASKGSSNGKKRSSKRRNKSDAKSDKSSSSDGVSKCSSKGPAPKIAFRISDQVSMGSSTMRGLESPNSSGIPFIYVNSLDSTGLNTDRSDPDNSPEAIITNLRRTYPYELRNLLKFYRLPLRATLTFIYSVFLSMLSAAISLLHIRYDALVMARSDAEMMRNLRGFMYLLSRGLCAIILKYVSPWMPPRYRMHAMVIVAANRGLVMPLIVIQSRSWRDVTVFLMIDWVFFLAKILFTVPIFEQSPIIRLMRRLANWYNVVPPHGVSIVRYRMSYVIHESKLMTAGCFTVAALFPFAWTLRKLGCVTAHDDHHDGNGQGATTSGGHHSAVFVGGDAHPGIAHHDHVHKAECPMRFQNILYEFIFPMGIKSFLFLLVVWIQELIQDDLLQELFVRWFGGVVQQSKEEKKQREGDVDENAGNTANGDGNGDKQGHAKALGSGQNESLWSTGNSLTVNGAESKAPAALAAAAKLREEQLREEQKQTDEEILHQGGVADFAVFCRRWHLVLAVWCCCWPMIATAVVNTGTVVYLRREGVFSVEERGI